MGEHSTINERDSKLNYHSALSNHVVRWGVTNWVISRILTIKSYIVEYKVIEYYWQNVSLFC